MALFSKNTLDLLLFNVSGSALEGPKVGYRDGTVSGCALTALAPYTRYPQSQQRAQLDRFAQHAVE